MNIISVLVFVFMVIPILYWWIRLAWWLIRVAYISLLILIDLAGRAWRRRAGTLLPSFNRACNKRPIYSGLSRRPVQRVP